MELRIVFGESSKIFGDSPMCLKRPLVTRLDGRKSEMSKL